MIRLFSRCKSVKEYTLHELKREIRKLSKGRIPADVIDSLAKRTVECMDFGNSYQMHKSIRGYAEIIIQNYFEEPNPYIVAPSCHVNLLELSRYAKKCGKKLTELTQEEVEQFAI